MSAHVCVCVCVCVCTCAHVCVLACARVCVCAVLLNAELTNCEMYPSLQLIMIIHHLALSLAVKEKA